MRRLLNLFGFRRRVLERDLDRELRYHLDRRVDDLRAAGLSEAEARRMALLEFGGVTQAKERTRETWVRQGLENRIRDLRYGVRALMRSPGFTLTAMLSLALVIGANTAVVSLFDQLLLRRLPVAAPEQLVLVDWIGSKAGTNWGSGNLMSYPLCLDLQQQKRVFQGVFCRHPTQAFVSTDGRPEQTPIEIVSGGYFEVLGVRPARGRLLSGSDDLTPDAHPVVVVSHNFWTTRMGAAADVVGRQIRINAHPMTVIGVAPAGFRGVDPASGPALWAPATMNRQVNTETIDIFNRRSQWLHIFARLQPGVTAQQARIALQPWFRAMLEEDLKSAGFPQVTPRQRRQFLESWMNVTPAPEGRSDLRERLKEPIFVLITGTLLLVLLACVNVANLFLARGAARAGEVTTRLALGASRGRITGELLTESLLVALGGGLLGLAAAPLVAEGLLSFVTSELSSSLDYRVFGFAFAVSLAAGALSGVIPAWRAGRAPLILTLKEQGRTVAGGAPLRKALVAGQIAFTLILLIGVGLFAQTLARLHAKGPGFETGSLLMFRTSPRSNGYSDADSERVLRELLNKLASTPGVERAALANAPILTGGTSSSGMTIQADTRIASDRAVHYMRVSPGFFETVGARLLAGRDFEERDVRDPEGNEPAYRSIIISESFARRYFGSLNPLGRRVGFGNRPNSVANIEVIGVVTGFTRRTLRDEIEQAFVPYWDGRQGGGTFYVKTRGRAEAALASMRRAAAEVDPALPIVDLITLDDQVDKSLATERMLATLCTGFGAIALALSAVGLYGVMAFVVTSRTREIGVRMALGAHRGTVVWMVARDVLAMAAGGIAAGLPAAWMLRRLVEAQLYEVTAVDVPTIAGAACFLGMVSLGAAVLPGWRATRVSPAAALRPE